MWSGIGRDGTCGRIALKSDLFFALGAMMSLSFRWDIRIWIYWPGLEL